MAKGRKTGGRKAGTPNKLTQSAREAFALAFDQVGGVQGLTEWARENRTEFYKLFSKTIPLDVTTNGKDLPALTWVFGDKKVTF